MLKRIRKNWLDILLVLFLLFLLIPGISLPFKAFVKRLFLMSPDTELLSDQQYLTNYNWPLVQPDGMSVNFNSARDKLVFVNFWATWCPPCRAELPSMNRAWAKVKDEGIAMLAINVGEDEDAIFAFTAEYPIDFTVLLDENSEQIPNWQITGLPTTYVLDPEGRVIFQAVGDREWDNDKLLDKVRALISTSKKTINTTDKPKTD